MQRKINFMLIILLVLSILLTGCGSKNDGEDKNGNQEIKPDVSVEEGVNNNINNEDHNTDNEDDDANAVQKITE